MNGSGDNGPALHGLLALVDECLDVAGLNPPVSADLEAAQPPADQQAAGGAVVDTEHGGGLAE